MKIQLDFDQKIISVEQDVKLVEFMDKIKSILPNWKEWKLRTNTYIYNWTNPIYIQDSRPWYVGTNPIYFDTTGNQFSIDNATNGIYNLEVN